MKWTGKMVKEYRTKRNWGKLKFAKHIRTCIPILNQLEAGDIRDKYADRLSAAYHTWQREKPRPRHHSSTQKAILRELDLSHLIKHKKAV